MVLSSIFKKIVCIPGSQRQQKSLAFEAKPKIKSRNPDKHDYIRKDAHKYPPHIRDPGVLRSF